MPSDNCESLTFQYWDHHKNRELEDQIVHSNLLSEQSTHRLASHAIDMQLQTRKSTKTTEAYPQLLHLDS